MPEETFETPQVVEPKTTNWPKIVLVAVLGFGLLAGAAYAGYYYGTQQVKQVEKPSPVISQPTPTPEPTSTPTPTVEDETSGWNTYTDTRFGYSVKYPKDATVNTPEDCAKTPIPGEGAGPGPCNSLTINLGSTDRSTAALFQLESWIPWEEENTDKDSVARFLDICRSFSWEDGYPIEKEIEVGGIKTKSIEGILQDFEEGNKWGFYTAVVSNNIRHEIVLEDTADRSNGAVIDQILSTFKFLD